MSIRMSGYVLVGGQSSRMGRDKALLPLGDVPLALHVAGQLQRVVSHVALLGATSTYQHLGLPVLADAPGEQGPLAGLCAGLAHSHYPWNVFVACDMPYVDSDVIGTLLRGVGTQGAQAVVPNVNGRWEPLCAAYHASCLPAMQAALRSEQRSVVRTFSRIQVHPISAEQLGGADRCLRIFHNANTPSDWQRVSRDTGGRDAHNG